jgi:hypothetical protein
MKIMMYICYGIPICTPPHAHPNIQQLLMRKWRQYVDIGTYMQKTLSYALQGVINALRVNDDDFFKATGTHCWIVRSAEEVIS